MTSYCEPTVLWRLEHANGATARATILPGSPTNTLAWFLNDTLDRVENFREWAPALARADETRRRMLEEGWRELEEPQASDHRS